MLRVMQCDMRSPGTSRRSRSYKLRTVPQLSSLRWITDSASLLPQFPSRCHPELVPGNHGMFAGFGEDEKKHKGGQGLDGQDMTQLQNTM